MKIRPLFPLKTSVICTDLNITLDTFMKRDPNPFNRYGRYEKSKNMFYYERGLTWDNAIAITIIMEPYV